MTVWRPAQAIRVKALGLAWREGRLLAAEVYDDAGRLKGVRPLGGSVEFGEAAEAAIAREFLEELGVEITVNAAPQVMENLYTHEGMIGHEVLFLYDVSLPSGAYEGQNEIHFAEDNGAECVARWYALDHLETETGPALFPTGLKARLTGA
ncbi:NUDIX domain-containing protein [Celeribacter sp. HF31]|nr:NUDIX domain-containing protein [Celeribacter sp. HF31]